ncbi:MAG: ubiquitin-like small modifier protein 1 [Candidatus Thorarchaeota archaeon]
MIDIKVFFLSLLADIVSEEEITLTIKRDSTVEDALNALIRKYGNKLRETILTSSDTLNKFILLGLNGQDIRSLDNLKTLLHNGDEISVLPAIAGG